MAESTEKPARQRRRGAELEAALLDAAWEDLVEVGYAGLTMESVAARAHTGVAVLYRRWPNKDQLTLAAIDRFGRLHPVETPDTGTLRGDLIALLTSFSEQRAAFVGTIAAAAFSGLLADTGMTPSQVREQLLPRQPNRRAEVYGRAAKRGELDLDHTPPTVLSMPIDLVRHDLLMTLEPVPPARIESIVDDLFLPLVGSGD